LAGLFAVALPNCTHAQFTADRQTNIISGVTNDWADDYLVGSNYVFDALLIQNGGVLSNNVGILGYTPGANSNLVLVSGTGAIWSSRSNLFLGYDGMANRLIITNRAIVFNEQGVAGADPAGCSNSAVVTGPGSVWSNRLSLYLGGNSAGNSLLISNQAKVFNDYGYIGYYTNSTDNSVIVTGLNSTWSNRSSLHVGEAGANNSLVITNQGKLFDDEGDVGFFSSSNRVLVTSSGSVWSNRSSLVVGLSGGENSLVIGNQGKVFDNYGNIGYYSSASNNMVVVTGFGSVWSNALSLNVGAYGSANTLVISNRGAVLGIGRLGGDAISRNNSVVVTGPGSIWRDPDDLTIGQNGSGNVLIITNQGTVISAGGVVGLHSGSSNNVVRVVEGGTWHNTYTLYVGRAGNDNELTIAGGSVFASTAFIGSGYFPDLPSNNLVRVESGNLIVTNSAGDGALVVGAAGGLASLVLNGGAVTVDQLVLTNGVNSVINFNAGTLISKGTAVANSQGFEIGNSSGSANFQLLGGEHWFNDGLKVRVKSSLNGCGTIHGDVVVEAGGTIRADCGGPLTFAGTVTNNGVIIADSGSVVECSGTLVNNGTILFLHAGTLKFQGIFINYGIILNGDLQLAFERDGSGGFFVRYTGAPDVTYRLQRAASLTGPWSDLATNTAPASGFIEFHETTPPPGQAFYRTAQP
jgi:T5SS/PEP-CTERM-associated repeat protein